MKCSFSFDLKFNRYHLLHKDKSSKMPLAVQRCTWQRIKQQVRCQKRWLDWQKATYPQQCKHLLIILNYCNMSHCIWQQLNHHLLSQRHHWHCRMCQAQAHHDHLFNSLSLGGARQVLHKDLRHHGHNQPLLGGPQQLKSHPLLLLGPLHPGPLKSQSPGGPHQQQRQGNQSSEFQSLIIQRLSNHFHNKIQNNFIRTRIHFNIFLGGVQVNQTLQIQQIRSQLPPLLNVQQQHVVHWLAQQHHHGGIQRPHRSMGLVILHPNHQKQRVVCNKSYRNQVQGHPLEIYQCWAFQVSHTLNTLCQRIQKRSLRNRNMSFWINIQPNYYKISKMNRMKHQKAPIKKWLTNSVVYMMISLHVFEYLLR